MFVIGFLTLYNFIVVIGLQQKVTALDALDNLYDSCFDFQLGRQCQAVDWAGIYEDLWSPQGSCPSGTLHTISMLQDGTVVFNTDACMLDSPAPPAVLVRDSPTSCVASVDFNAAHRTGVNAQFAGIGAFTYGIQLGTVDGRKVITWTGLYSGYGGMFLPKDAPPKDCANIWAAANIGTGTSSLITYLNQEVSALRFQQPTAMCTGFQPLTSCPAGAWEGAFVDLFTPAWSTCPKKTREVVRGEGGTLVASFLGCDGAHGFLTATGRNPLLWRDSDTSCTAKLGYDTAFPPDSPYYNLSKTGAFRFTLTLGTFNNAKVIRWSGLYNGQGGPWRTWEQYVADNGELAPPEVCNNFWLQDVQAQFAAVDAKVEELGFMMLGPVCDGFVEATSCPASEWLGAYADLYSPYSSCTAKQRVVGLDYHNRTSTPILLHTGCDGVDGFSADATMPTLVRAHPMSCTAYVSYHSTYAPDSPLATYEAQGAFHFTLTMGYYQDDKVIRWNGLYNGLGGAWQTGTVPPTACANIWKSEKDDTWQLPAMCQAFVPSTICTESDWTGTFEDMFSADFYFTIGTGCTSPLRTVTDWSVTTNFSTLGTIQEGCDGGTLIQYGHNRSRIFREPGACTAIVDYANYSFAPGSRYHELADLGAFRYELTLGTAAGKGSVMRWSGPYAGFGGTGMNGAMEPANDCSTFWMKLAETPPFTQERMCAADGFTPLQSCDAASWAGSYEDLFSPRSGENACPSAQRAIAVGAGGEIIMEQPSCSSVPGRNPNATRASVTRNSADSCVGMVSFPHQYLSTSPYFPYVQQGALEFTIQLGTYGGQTVMKWNGLYNGAPGSIVYQWYSPSLGQAITVPSDSCSNFWVRNPMAS